MKNILADWWLVLTTPMCWIRNYPYSEEWDRELQVLMAMNQFRTCQLYPGSNAISDLEVLLDDTVIWARNHPYASFRPEQRGVMPRRITTIRAMQKLQKELVSFPKREV